MQYRPLRLLTMLLDYICREPTAAAKELRRGASYQRGTDSSFHFGSITEPDQARKSAQVYFKRN